MLTLERLSGLSANEIRSNIKLQCAGGTGSAEVLAMQGDALLSMHILQIIIRKFPSLTTRETIHAMKERYTSNESLAFIAKKLRVYALIDPPVAAKGQPSRRFSEWEMATTLEAMIQLVNNANGYSASETFAAALMDILDSSTLSESSPSTRAIRSESIGAGGIGSQGDKSKESSKAARIFPPPVSVVVQKSKDEASLPKTATPPAVKSGGKGTKKSPKLGPTSTTPRASSTAHSQEQGRQDANGKARIAPTTSPSKTLSSIGKKESPTAFKQSHGSLTGNPGTDPSHSMKGEATPRRESVTAIPSLEKKEGEQPVTPVKLSPSASPTKKQNKRKKKKQEREKDGQQGDVKKELDSMATPPCSSHLSEAAMKAEQRKGTLPVLEQASSLCPSGGATKEPRDLTFTGCHLITPRNSQRALFALIRGQLDRLGPLELDQLMVALWKERGSFPSSCGLLLEPQTLPRVKGDYIANLIVEDMTLPTPKLITLASLPDNLSIPCPACKIPLKKLKNVIEHINERCPRRYVSCDQCDLLMTADCMNNHDCDDIIECKDCGYKVNSTLWHLHLKQEGPIKSYTRQDCQHCGQMQMIDDDIGYVTHHNCLLTFIVYDIVPYPGLSAQEAADLRAIYIFSERTTFGSCGACQLDNVAERPPVAYRRKEMVAHCCTKTGHHTRFPPEMPLCPSTRSAWYTPELSEPTASQEPAMATSSPPATIATPTLPSIAPTPEEDLTTQRLNEKSTSPSTSGAIGTACKVQ